MMLDTAPLFILRDSMGIQGIIRARTWEDAYKIAEDGFFPDADEEANAELARIEAMEDGPERDHAQACWGESYGYRNSGRSTAEGKTSCIYAHDLNGEALDQTTQEELLTRYNIALDITTEPEDPTA